MASLQNKPRRGNLDTHTHTTISTSRMLHFQAPAKKLTVQPASVSGDGPRRRRSSRSVSALLAPCRMITKTENTSKTATAHAQNHVMRCASQNRRPVYLSVCAAWIYGEGGGVRSGAFFQIKQSFSTSGEVHICPVHGTLAPTTRPVAMGHWRDHATSWLG